VPYAPKRTSSLWRSPVYRHRRDDRANRASAHGEQKPVVADRKNAPRGHSTHHKGIQFPDSAGLIPKDQADAWRRAGAGRNRILHAAMWMPDAVTDKDGAQATAVAKEPKRFVERLKRVQRVRAVGGL